MNKIVLTLMYVLAMQGNFLAVAESISYNSRGSGYVYTSTVDNGIAPMSTVIVAVSDITVVYGTSSVIESEQSDSMTRGSTIFGSSIWSGTAFVPLGEVVFGDRDVLLAVFMGFNVSHMILFISTFSTLFVFHRRLDDRVRYPCCEHALNKRALLRVYKFIGAYSGVVVVFCSVCMLYLYLLA
jgi:hypothetical protein